MVRTSPREVTNRMPHIGRKYLLPYLLIFFVVPILTFISGQWLDRMFQLPKFPPFPFNLLFGLGVFFFGLTIGIRSTRLLYSKGRGLPWGELAEEARSARLVTNGLYACCRNPMTFGYSLLPFGMGIIFRSPSMTFIISAIILTIAIILLKVWEEPILERRFGEAYLEYKRRTPFLFPRMKPLVLDLFSPMLKIQQNEQAKRPSSFGLVPLVYIGLSLLGLCLLTVLTFNIPVSVGSIAWQRQVTGSIFMAICILGTIAGISPSRCSQMTHSRTIGRSQYESNSRNVEETTTALEGHHPTCESFSSHVIQFRGETYCAGCTGLVMGAIMSLLGSLLYFFSDLSAGEAGALIFWLGFVGVACGLLQYNLTLNRRLVHVLLNVVFVVGAFLLLVGVNEVNGNVVLNYYLLILIVYWIIAKIMMSQLEHEKICSTCGLKSCSHSFS